MNMSLAKLKKFIKNRKGFLLVDGMVAVLVVAIGLAALAYLYTNGIGTMHKSDTREKAVQVAADWTEVIKQYETKRLKTDKDALTSTFTEADLSTYLDTTLPKDKSNAVKTTTDNETFAIKSEILTTYGTNFKNNNAYLVPVKVTVTWNSPEAQSYSVITYVTINKLSS